MLIDPHTATGTVAARRARRRRTRSSRWRRPTRRSSPTPSSGRPASARRCPTHLADLFERPERTETIPNDLAVVEDYVARVSRVG